MIKTQVVKLKVNKTMQSILMFYATIADTAGIKNLKLGN